MFIPNYFVRFGSQKAKPLGIAYADLPTPEEAEEVIQALHGSLFKDRKLRVWSHVPYNPNPPMLRLRGGSLRRLARNEESSEQPPVGDVLVEDVEVGALEEVPAVSDEAKNDTKYSDTTLFVKGIRHKVTEEGLCEFFGEFKPATVKFVKPRGFIRGLKSRSHKALVSFELQEGVTIDKIIDDCKDRLFEGYKLSVGRAFAGRERGSAPAAEEAPKPEPEQAPAAEAEGAGVEGAVAAAEATAPPPEPEAADAASGEKPSE